MEATERQDADRSQEFPGAPWHLQGQACVSLWRVPRRVLPIAARGLRYAAWGEHALLFTIWASYQPGGTLAYDEFAVAVPVRGTGSLAACTVIHIWVSDAASAAGGRHLWAIPKMVGSFDTQPAGEAGRVFSGQLHEDGRAIASLRFEHGVAWPGRPCMSGFVVQAGEGGPIRTRCTANGSLATGRATWSFAADGPLAYLNGHRPLVSARVNDLRLACGV